MSTPKIVIRKDIDWHEYGMLGFDLEGLQPGGRFSWWADFVKTYTELYVEFYDNCFEVMLTKKNGETTALKQLSFNHLQVKMTIDREILMLITHPDTGKIYVTLNNEDFTKGTWMDLLRIVKAKKKAEKESSAYRKVKF